MTKRAAWNPRGKGRKTTLRDRVQDFLSASSFFRRENSSLEWMSAAVDIDIDLIRAKIEEKIQKAEKIGTSEGKLHL